MNTPDENKSPESGPENLFPDKLEIDEVEASRISRERGKELDISDELRLLARQNRLSLFKTKTSRHPSSQHGSQSEAQFRLQSHAHPGCRFVQVMLAVNVELTPGARVLSILPEEAMLHQVKVTEAIKPGFETDIIGIKISLGSEKTTEQTFESRVLSGYNGEDHVVWTFVAPTSDYELSLNTPLSLSISYPTATDALRASVQLSARIALRGWSGAIPLIGKKSGEGQTLVYLDR